MLATTIRQGELLLLAGLDPKTADMKYVHRVDGTILIPQQPLIDSKIQLPLLSNEEPAWSLDALVEVMCFKEQIDVVFFRSPSVGWICSWRLFDDSVRKDLNRVAESKIEAAFLVLYYLLSHGYIKGAENG